MNAYFYLRMLVLVAVFGFFLTGCVDENLNGLEQSTAGTNGSYSQMIVVGDFLYGINGPNLSTLDIRDKNNTSIIDQQRLDFDIESLYSFQGLLFVGSSQRLYIMELADNGVPKLRVAEEYVFEDIFTPCDPVVANSTHAFVTLSSLVRNEAQFNFLDCGQVAEVNELRIFDITDLENVDYVSSTPMSNPKGLGLDGSTLFVCDGENGLVVFDISDVNNVLEIESFHGFNAYDCIVKDDLLIVVAEDQLLQYDYSDLTNIRLLGSFEL